WSTRALWKSSEVGNIQKTRILLRQGACCPNQKERGPVARSNSIPAETSEIFPFLGKSDIAAAHRAALRHLGNTPQGYGGRASELGTRRGNIKQTSNIQHRTTNIQWFGM